MKGTARTISFAVVSLVLVACTGGPGDPTMDQQPQQSEASTVDWCSGEFRCSYGGKEVVTTRLERSDGACFAGQVRLYPDGRAAGDDVVGTWRVSGSGFTACLDGICIDCTRVDAARSTSNTSSTAFESAEACERQDGCSRR